MQHVSLFLVGLKHDPAVTEALCRHINSDEVLRTNLSLTVKQDCQAGFLAMRHNYAVADPNTGIAKSADADC